MRKYVLIPFLSVALFSGVNAVAQDRAKYSSKEESTSSSDDEKACCHSSHSNYHCWRAWKKDVKREKKICKARYWECYNPWVAERKWRKAHKKAWKRDVIEHDHVYGYDHNYWF
jgi:hypothetical protein